MKEKGIAVLLNDEKLTDILTGEVSEDLKNAVEWLDHPCWEHSSKDDLRFRGECILCFQILKRLTGVK